MKQNWKDDLNAVSEAPLALVLVGSQIHTLVKTLMGCKILIIYYLHFWDSRVTGRRFKKIMEESRSNDEGGRLLEQVVVGRVKKNYGCGLILEAICASVTSIAEEAPEA